MIIFPNIVVNIGLIICGINFELTNWLSVTNIYSNRGTMFMNITEICLHHHHNHHHTGKEEEYDDVDDGYDKRTSSIDINDHRNNDIHNEKDGDNNHYNDERTSSNIRSNNRYKGIKIRIKYYSDNDTFNKLKSNFYNDVDEAANDCMHLLMLEWYQQQQSFHYKGINNDNNDDIHSITDDNHGDVKSPSRGSDGNRDTHDDDDDDDDDNNNNIHQYGRVVFPKVYYMNTNHFSGDLFQ